MRTQRHATAAKPQPPDGTSEMLCVNQVRTIIGPTNIAINTIYDDVRSGQIPSTRIGGRILIPRSWLRKVLSGQTSIVTANRREIC